MEKEQLIELNRVIELAQQGNWIPAAMVAGFLSLVIFLILYIYSLHRKDATVKHDESDIRHQSSEKQLTELTKIAIELKTDKTHKDIEIRDLKRGVGTNKEDIKDILKK